MHTQSCLYVCLWVYCFIISVVCVLAVSLLVLTVCFQIKGLVKLMLCTNTEYRIVIGKKQLQEFSNLIFIKIYQVMMEQRDISLFFYSFIYLLTLVFYWYARMFTIIFLIRDCFTYSVILCLCKKGLIYVWLVHPVTTMKTQLEINIKLYAPHLPSRLNTPLQVWSGKKWV